MQKQFSIKVPDELYIEKYTSNTYATFTYEGPETLYAEVQADGTVFGLVDENTTYPEGELRYVVEIDANEYPSAAHYLKTFADPYTYTYEDVENHDGSIYKKITNPRIQDYFRLVYNKGAFNSRDDGLNVGPWSFQVIQKVKEFVEEEQIRKSLQKVKQTLGNIALDDSTQTAYNNYVQACETYLTTMEPLYPWKYVSISDPIPPKLPLALIKAMNEVAGVLGD